MQWCYDVVDHLHEDRSVVYVAMNILDRYSAATASTRPIDEKMFEIASLASIFLAVRIAGSGDLLLQELLSMSRGGIAIQDIITMGTFILSALSWEYCILTPFDFAKSIFDLLPSLNNSSQKQVIFDFASYLIELAVCDVFFSHFKASSLALAAILNALQANLCSEVSAFKEVVLKATSYFVDLDETTLLCARLQGVYSRSADNLSQGGPHLVEDDDEEAEANISQAYEVFAGCTVTRDREVSFEEESSLHRKRTKIDL